MAEPKVIRRCNGGQAGPWCGRYATVVVTDSDGMQWFTCDEHPEEGLATEPIAEFLARAWGVSVAEAREALAIPVD